MSDQPAPERVRVSGPLVGFADGFRGDLLDRGYSLWGAQEQFYLLAHVSRWMESEGLDVTALTPERLERYFVWRRRQGYLSSLSPLSLRTLLGYLDGLGVLPLDDTVPSPVDRLLAEFQDYLLRERGIKASSAAQYLPTARLFLARAFRAAGAGPRARVRCRGQHVRVAGVPAALAALDRDGGLRTPGAAAVLAPAGVDRRAARGGRAIGRAASGGSPARAAGRAGEAVVGQL